MYISILIRSVSYSGDYLFRLPSSIFRLGPIDRVVPSSIFKFVMEASIPR